MTHHLSRPPIEPLRVYSRLEAAEVLNISLSTVRRLIASGQLRASQPNGMRRVFITGQAMLDFLEATQVDPASYIDSDEDD
ncbi:MAG: helix-turn-helix domain-containing protein [Anaerolineae bacterium]|nr:helix-turn-helix domain-containing protein [Anaerolineae bacterium]